MAERKKMWFKFYDTSASIAEMEAIDLHNFMVIPVNALILITIFGALVIASIATLVAFSILKYLWEAFQELISRVMTKVSCLLETLQELVARTTLKMQCIFRAIMKVQFSLFCVRLAVKKEKTCIILDGDMLSVWVKSTKGEKLALEEKLTKSQENFLLSLGKVVRGQLLLHKHRKLCYFKRRARMF